MKYRIYKFFYSAHLTFLLSLLIVGFLSLGLQGQAAGTDPNGASCINDSTCQSGYCAPDGNCKADPNQPTCTPACTAPQVCQNGSCVTPGAGTANDKLYNPLSQDSLTGVVVNVLKGFLAIMGIWAVAFIVFGGFKMVISQGNEEAVASAKKTIMWAVLGLVIGALSFAIIAMVQNIIGIDVKAP